MPISLDVGLLPQEPIQAAARFAAIAEELGFGGVWVADSQSVFRDAFLALGAAAEATSRITLATGVTNPKTRHPAVLAGAAATLAEASGGRALIGIGVGESSVRNIGVEPATVAELERFVVALRSLLAGEATTFAGSEARISWDTPAVPIIVAASGPRMLRLAGRLGDGVLFQVGARVELAEYAIEQIAAGAAEAGRSLDDLSVSMRLAAVVDDDRERARSDVEAYASVAANTLARTIPRSIVPDLEADLDRLRGGYDYAQHGYAEAEHRRLLTDGLIDAVALIGESERVGRQLADLGKLGVDRFVIPVNVPDKVAGLERLASLRPWLDGDAAAPPDGGEDQPRRR